MTKKIFKTIILVAATVLIMGIAFVMAILYQYFGTQLTTELKKQATYLSYGVEELGADYLKEITDVDARITYIGEDGEVIYDNEADASEMGNHKDREEFIEAEETGYGDAERMSDTLSEKTVYYALRLEDNSVLRVSSTQSSILSLTLQMMLPVIGIFVLMLMLAGVIAMHLADRIVEPINNLDLDHPELNETYKEIDPLLSRIYKQNRQIRTQLETARRNQEEFMIITENMQEGLLVIDSHKMILSGNTSVWRMFQLKKAKTGDNVFELNRDEDFRGVVTQALSGKHASSLLHIDGEFIHVTGNPVTGDKGIVGAVLLLVNETEKVERENLRREFSANVSHELKTPLTSISGFAEIIQNGLVKDGDIQVFAGRIYKEAQRLITLVEDTIKVSQLDEGANPYEWETVEAVTLTKNVCSNLVEIARKNNVHLFVDGDKLEFQTVRSILEEVLYNLIDNGIKYNKDDGTVRIKLREDGDSVKISVKDTGIGIPGEDRSRVFERFYRVDKSHSKEIGGTGLGLSIVRHGVSFLGGTLSMMSVEGQGTEITMTFPKQH